MMQPKSSDLPPTPTQTIRSYKNDIPRKRSKSSEVSSDSPTKAKIRKTSADHAKGLKPQSIEDLKITKPKIEPTNIYEPSTSKESIEISIPTVKIEPETEDSKSTRQESDSDSSDEETLKSRRKRGGRKPGRAKRVVTKTQAIHILINRRPLPPSKYLISLI